MGNSEVVEENESTIQSNISIIADETSSKNVSEDSVISVDFGSSDSPSVPVMEKVFFLVSLTFFISTIFFSVV